MTGSTEPRDWRAWHRDYDDPASGLAGRLAVVQRRFAEVLDACPPGPVRVVSACAGEGRDVLGVLESHERAGDVRARLVELDPVLAATARARAAAVGLDGVEVLVADAGSTDAYEGAVPADVVLLCGIFGNVVDDDIERTVATASSLCAPGAVVIWTRHRVAPDATPAIRRWFTEAGFEEVAFDAGERPDGGPGFGVGTARLAADPAPFRAGVRLFTFV